MNRNLKSLTQKLFTYQKKFLSLFYGAVVFTLLVFTYFFFRLGKNYFSPPKPREEKLPELEEEISSETNSQGEIGEAEVVAETNHSLLGPEVQAYYQQIITKIHSGNIHGSVITPSLRSESERTNNSPYWLCAVPTCQWTVGRKQCAHNRYFLCPESDCAFFQSESYGYYDYCSLHTCQRCQQLVVIYEDNHCEKYCAHCLPQTVADYPTPIF